MDKLARLMERMMEESKRDKTIAELQQESTMKSLQTAQRKKRRLSKDVVTQTFRSKAKTGTLTRSTSTAASAKVEMEPGQFPLVLLRRLSEKVVEAVQGPQRRKSV